MISAKVFLICGLLLLPFTQVYSQGNPNVILRGVYHKLQKAKDYSVHANIKVDMPFIRMLPINAKIYFKQKNKFKVESKSIAVVPRQGFDQLSRIMSDTTAFTTMLQGTDKLGQVLTSLVNVIPLSDTSDLIFAKFWIDPVQSIIVKSQLTTKSNGTILTEYSYGSEIDYGLPDMMIFSVDVKKFKMPKGMGSNVANASAAKPDTTKGNKKGKIHIVLTNYIINKGISDEVFKK